jgi:hypothetical protein
MHLLRFDNDDFISLISFDTSDAPEYAILSHTWGSDDEELNYTELKLAAGVYAEKVLEDGEVNRLLTKGGNLDPPTRKREIERIKKKIGYQKIQFCGRQAAKDDLEYFWIDSCCIDKENSTELSEAINSMFKWYKRAVKCYVYLRDVLISPVESAEVSHPENAWVKALQGSKWFTRGWTLQELLAPKHVEFFSREGKYIGEREEMSSMLSAITSIPVEALRGRPLSKFTIKERFSWVGSRQTKREEDKAYALFGIFDVYMPPIYGEGEDSAMNRLRKEIREVERTLLQSLRFDQIGSRQTAIKNPHNETCQWLLITHEYLDWLDPDKLEEHQGFLWIKGIPGAGKSTIMKFAHGCVHQALERSQEQFRIRHLKRKTLSPNHGQAKTASTACPTRRALEPIEDTVVLAFFFNARGATLEKSTVGLYRSLLAQLIERRAYLDIAFSLLPFATSELGDNYPWNIGILQQLFREVIIRVKRPVVCFIDALDECEEQQIRDMISFLRQTSDRARKAGIAFRTCFASRHYPHISLDRGGELILERQEGHDKDIAEYLNAELRIGNSDTAQLIRQEIRRKASGVFMWVVLVVSILNRTSDRGQIYALQRKLSEIPADLNTLFRDMVTRNSESKAQLVLCVKWLLFASRPMSPKECYFAILFELEPDLALELNAYEIPYDAMERFLLDCSKGLAHITPWSRPAERSNDEPTRAFPLAADISPPSLQVVQFIHESVRDFLLEYGGFQIIEPGSTNNFHRNSHRQLARCCLHYMASAMLLDAAIPPVPWMSESRMQPNFSLASLNHYPFLEYAVSHVIDHATKAGFSGIEMIRSVSNFRSDQQRLSGKANITFVCWGDMTNSEHEQLYEQTFHACFTLIVVKRSVIVGIACEVHDNKESVRIFADDDDRASFETDRRFRIRRGGNRHLLSYMAECAPVRVMVALLGSGRFDVNLLDPDGMAPLDYALKRGDNAIIDLLYKAGAVKHRRGSLPRDFLCTRPAEIHEQYDLYGNGRVRETHEVYNWYGDGTVRERM